MTWLAVILGGALGSAARHGINLVAPRVFGSATPYATASVNLMGSLAIGLLAGALASERVSLTPLQRVFIFTGLLGGFTTFSSLMHDSLVLGQAGTARSAANLAVQVGLGLVLVYAGYRLGLGSTAR
jgi:CrcB protein